MNAIQKTLPLPTSRQARLVESFEAFHQRHPEFWETFRDLAFEAMRRGRKQYSARDLMAIARWESPVDGRDPDLGDPFKVCNNWSPFYARMFAERYPQHQDFFEFREAAADSVGTIGGQEQNRSVLKVVQKEGVK